MSFPGSSGLGAGWLCFLRINFLAWKSFLVPVEMRGVCGCPCLKTSLATWSVTVKFVRDVRNTLGLMFSLENWEFYTVSFFFFKKLFLGMLKISRCSFSTAFFKMFKCVLLSLPLLKVRNLFGYVHTSKLNVPGTVLWSNRCLQGSLCPHTLLCSLVLQNRVAASWLAVGDGPWLRLAPVQALFARASLGLAQNCARGCCRSIRVQLVVFLCLEMLLDTPCLIY